MEAKIEAPEPRTFGALHFCTEAELHRDSKGVRQSTQHQRFEDWLKTETEICKRAAFKADRQISFQALPSN